MEKNTVLISVEDYNELRDFKREISNGNTCIINSDIYLHHASKFVSESDAVKIIAKENESLTEKLIEKEEEIKGENQLKSMTFWEWLKWRKS
jgi:hypothetical protein